MITGARSDFGIIELVVEKILQSPRLELQLCITGMHLLKQYGYTLEEIEKRKYPNIFIVPMYDENGNVLRTKFTGAALSKGILNFSKLFSELKTDIVLVSGDRVEMLAACLAGATLGTAIVHIHGGDISESAQIDEQIRHAITKFAHLHFAASELSKRRILQMGEENWRVFNTGSPELDYVYTYELYSKKELLDELGISTSIGIDDNFILCVQHPSIYEAEKSGIHMRMILKCLAQMHDHTIIIYPNNDPGNEYIIEEIIRVQDNPKFHIYKNLSRKTYLSVLKYALFMIGNSSSGIIESAIFHLPVINIGIRNLNRECSKNVITIGSTKNEIQQGIQTVLSQEFRSISKEAQNLYGDGTASKKIVEILESTELNDKLFTKKFVLL